MLSGEPGWKGQLRPESREKQRETWRWKHIRDAYVFNEAERQKALAKIHPNQHRYNAELFLLSELYPSAAMLSRQKRPVWECPIKPV